MKKKWNLILGFAAVALMSAAAHAANPQELNGIYETADGKLLMADGVLYNDADKLSLMIKDAAGNDREFAALRKSEGAQSVPFVYVADGCVVSFTPYEADGKKAIHAEAVPGTCEADKDFKNYSGDFIKREGAAAEQPWPM